MPPEGREDGVGQAVRAIAAAIGNEHYPPGSLAALRRLNPDAAMDGPFWDLLIRYTPDALGDDRERMWAAVIRGMAIMTRPGSRGEGPPPGLGAALAEAEVSELRFLRLLRTGADGLPEELRRLARLMASKGVGFDWADAWWLLATAGSDGADRTRRNLARGYYQRRYARDQARAGRENAA